LVRAPAFKAWFGDWENDPANASKVVDENGEPLVCSHYSQKSKIFNEFTKQKPNQTRNFNSLSKEGYYFSTADEDSMAKVWNRSKKGFLYKVFLNVKNILDLGDKNAYDFKTKKAVDWKVFTFEMLEKYVTKGRQGSFDDYTEYNKNVDFFTIEEINESSKNKILKLGYNGVWGDKDKYADSVSDQFYGTDQIVVFNANQIKLADGTNTTFDSSNDDIRFEKGGRTIAQTPAPKKDRVYGSDLNKGSSSKDLSSAKLINFDSKTLEVIKNKVQEHNRENPDRKINLASAKAVVRRGFGAYSKSHRPTISGGKPNSRVAWGLARLNAFTYKIVNGKSKSGKYSQDDDLIEELGFEVADYKNGGEMKKDIRCINCGWEWNKKDSELWDMYVCHKCGFDNTTFYTSIPVNNYSKGGNLERKNPDYLKMFLGK
jgi:hypothetical protein